MKASLDYQISRLCDIGDNFEAFLVYELGWELCSLYYYPEDNMFTDDCGFLIYDILYHVTPNTLFLFKRYKVPMYVPDFENKIVLELLYSGPEDEE